MAISLPKMEFDNKKAGIAGGVLVLAVAGWLAWDMFMTEPPPPPPPVAAKPPAPKPPAQAVADRLAEPSAARDKAEGDKKTEMAKAEIIKSETAKAEAKPAAGAPAAAPVIAPPVQVAVAAAGPRALTARSKMDARECLKQETNQAIHRCAEGYR